MAGGKVRYQFRAWSRDFRGVLAALLRLSQSGQIERRSEEYIICPGDGRFEIKTRGDLIEGKALMEKAKRLEVWQRRLECTFPLDAGTLRREVCPPLALAHVHVEQEVYQMRDFLNRVVRRAPHLMVVPVHTKRFAFTFGDVQAEYAEVWVNKVSLETVGLESDGVASTLSAMMRLGLQGHENCNYVRAIKSIVGMELTRVIV